MFKNFLWLFRALKEKENLKKSFLICAWQELKIFIKKKKIKNLNNLHKKWNFFVICSTGHSFQSNQPLQHLIRRLQYEIFCIIKIG